MIAITQKSAENQLSSFLPSYKDSSAGAIAIFIGDESHHNLHIYRRIVGGEGYACLLVIDTIRAKNMNGVIP
jgi:hypothetical protein